MPNAYKTTNKESILFQIFALLFLFLWKS